MLVLGRLERESIQVGDTVIRVEAIGPAWCVLVVHGTSFRVALDGVLNLTDDTSIMLVRVLHGGKSVRLGISAPRSVVVVRTELLGR